MQSPDTIDPSNRLLWRQNRWRLEAEPIRDSILFVSGLLDKKMGGSLLKAANNDYARGEGDYNDVFRRAVYLPVVRVNGYQMFNIFDHAENAVHLGRRGTTTVAPQALFMMNSSMVIHSAEAMATRLLKEGGDSAARVQRLYLTVYGRPATDRDLATASSFVTTGSKLADSGAASASAAWTELCQALLASNEFVYVR